MAPVILRPLVVGAMLAVAAPFVGAMRSTVEFSDEVEEKAIVEANASEESIQVQTGRGEGLVTLCNLDSKGEIIDCGPKGRRCDGKCVRQESVHFADIRPSAACTRYSMMPPKCVSNAYSVWRQKVHFTGRKDARYCCLCPVGKKYDTAKGYCVTRSIAKQTLPCSAVPGGWCRDPQGTLDLAGSSPEAACRTRKMFTTGCRDTALSTSRLHVSIPGVFSGYDKAYCCVCPENSVYSSANKACVCRRSTDGLELLLPRNGVCPESYDAATARGHDAVGAGPALEQITAIRDQCLNSRYADELMDPLKYRNFVIRKGLGADTGLVVQSVKVLKFDTVVKFDQEASGGVSIELVEDLQFELGLGSLIYFKDGHQITLTAPDGGYSLHTAARLGGKESLSRIVDFGSSGHLSIHFDKMDLHAPAVPIHVHTLIVNHFKSQILGGVLSNIFGSIGISARKASIEGPLATVMEGKETYPIQVRTRVENAGCPQSQLCLALSFGLGQSQASKPEKQVYGATLEDFTFTTKVVGGRDFTSSIVGGVKLDVDVALDKVINDQNQNKLDMAYGDIEPEKPEEPDEDDVDKAKRTEERTKELVNNEVCKARLKDYNAHRAFWTVAHIGGSITRRVMDLSGAAFSLYSSSSLAASPKEHIALLVPSDPGTARGDFETDLLTAWQKLFPQQKGIFSRSQNEGEEPTFAVVSLSTVKLEARGSLRLNKVGSTIKAVGELSLSSAMIYGLRYHACAPKSRFTAPQEFTDCWVPKYLDGNDVGLAPTRVAVTAEVNEGGGMSACAAVEHVKIISGFSRVLDETLNAAIAGVKAKRFLEDFLEAQLGTAIYEAVIVRQKGKFSGAHMDIILSPDGLHLDIGLQADWGDIGRLQAQIGSVPAEAAEKVAPSSQGDIGSAWEVLKERQDRLTSEEDKSLLREATSKFSRDLRQWMPLGKLGVTSELLSGMDLTGSVNLARRSQPVQLSGRINVNLNRIVHSSANEAGVTDYGYTSAAEIVQVSLDGGRWVEAEAVVSCGYLFISAVTTVPGHFRLTEGGKPRQSYKLDLGKSQVAAGRDKAESYVEKDQPCGHNIMGLRGVAPGGVAVSVCVPPRGLAEVAISAELTKRDLMDQMITKEGYRAGMLWSGMKLGLKNGPFILSTGGGRRDVVEESCGDELLRCESALQCMGVQFYLEECSFLSVYDLDSKVKGSYIHKVYQVGGPETWGILEGL